MTIPPNPHPKQVEALNRAEKFAKGLNTTPEEHDDIMVAVELARASLANRPADDGFVMAPRDMVQEIADCPLVEVRDWSNVCRKLLPYGSSGAVKNMPTTDDRPADDGERWRHVKRGTEYTVLGTGELQDAAGQGLHEGHMLVIYRGDDGQLWARHPNEFYDGRFVEIAPQPEGVKRP